MNRKMRYMALLLALCLLLPLFGCGAEERVEHDARLNDIWVLDDDTGAAGSLAIFEDGRCELRKDGLVLNGTLSVKEEGLFVVLDGEEYQLVADWLDHENSGIKLLGYEGADSLLIFKRIEERGVEEREYLPKPVGSDGELLDGLRYYRDPDKPAYTEDPEKGEDPMLPLSEEEFLEIAIGEWYGWVAVTEAWGYTDNSDEIHDAYGIVDIDAGTGVPFIEMTTPELENPFLSMYIDASLGAIIKPIIGYEDAWIMDRYLTDEDWEDVVLLYDGSAIFGQYEYRDPNADAGYTITVYIRPYGALWDESEETVPPGYYDDYLKSLSDIGI